MKYNIKKTLLNNASQQFSKFVIIGILSVMVNYFVFLLLYSFLDMYYLFSSAIGYMSGVSFGFVLNKTKIFGSKHYHRNALIKYFIVLILSLFLGLSILKTMVHDWGINPFTANIFIIGITTLTNFFGNKFFAFQKLNIPKIFYNKFFIVVLFLKIIFSFLFGSDFIVKGFAPFVNEFISSGFQNPYNFFLDQGLVKAFPYSTIMLIVVTIPTYIFYFLMDLDWQTILPANLLLMRIPLLIADMGIFYILTLLLKGKEKSILLFYWASPIVFYINYFHGQLDSIPIFFLMLSIYLLLVKKEVYAFLVLGLAMASKANIFAAVPFIFLYLWRNKHSIPNILRYFSISFMTYFALILPYLFSEGYKRLVLLAEEQIWLYLLKIPYFKNDLILYVAPFAISILFFRMAYFKSMNRDSFIMSITVVFIILVSLVPPQPGWFFWSIPFLTYFFIKDECISKKYYYMISFFYILHFLILRKDSDIFQSFQVIIPKIANINAPYLMLANLGLNVQFISNIVFTIFVGILLTNGFFVYKNGVISNLEYKASLLNIGIAGDSGSGKTWTNNLIKDLVGDENVTFLLGDDLHKWERGDNNWKVITHLNPKGNYLNLDIEHLRNIKENKIIYRKNYDHNTGKLIERDRVSQSKFIVISGLHSFYLNKMRQLLDIKIFMDPNDQLRAHWKILRDIKERAHSKKSILFQLKQRSKDSKKYIQPQKEFADIVIEYKPKSPIKNLESGTEKFELLLKMTLDNSYSPHEILDSLYKAKSIAFDLVYDKNMKTYTCTFSGEISKKEVESTAYELFPNFEEVLDNMYPVWHNNYDGIVQLFILYVINEHLKNKENIRHAQL